MGTDRDSAVSRQRFDVADAAPLLIDADGFVTSWTRDAELLFGYPAAEILGRSVRTLLLDEDDERIGLLAETHRALGGWSGILTARHRDGHPLKVMVRVVPTHEATSTGHTGGSAPTGDPTALSGPGAVSAPGPAAAVTRTAGATPAHPGTASGTAPAHGSGPARSSARPAYGSGPAGSTGAAAPTGRPAPRPGRPYTDRPAPPSPAQGAPPSPSHAGPPSPAAPVRGPAPGGPARHGPPPPKPAPPRPEPSRTERSPEPLPHERYLWDGSFHWGEWTEPRVRAADGSRVDP
ncbi:PAS domain S-box protein, partial [Streptomyces scabiei]|uniref:PAS domain S-box protein n=1 Tax=Streptomyces scabiei TaxID=1930 RepID=UPI000A47A580